MIKFENKTNGRFYYLSIERDILNDIVLRIVRGGANSCVSRTVGFDNVEAINQEVQRIIKKRLQRGYTLV